MNNYKVGEGSFGHLMTARKNDDEIIYAVIVKRKSKLTSKSHKQEIKMRSILLYHIDHPFIVSLRYVFESKSRLHMILDYFDGGELFFHVKREGRFSERRSCFYSAQICLALKHLHFKNIIYYDLKPENIFLTLDGYIKITDFYIDQESLTKTKNHVTRMFNGTPQYLAPEVIQVRYIYETNNIVNNCFCVMCSSL